MEAVVAPVRGLPLVEIEVPDFFTGFLLVLTTDSNPVRSKNYSRSGRF